jgi:superfamily II DNA or RNA helicase
LIAAAFKEMPKLPSFPDDPLMLILTATIDHAFRLRQYLPDFEVVYASLSKAKLDDLKKAGIVEEDYVSLTAKKRDELLKGFEQGKIRHAIATGCWGEGVDFVHLDVLANAAGQYSSIDTAQWAGRNSRIYEGKQHGIVIDSMDQWDPWALSRAKQRMRVYKSKGWEVEKFAKYIERARNEVIPQEAMDA